MDMPDEPTPPFAPYFRPDETTYGSVERLQSLSDGYFGLNWVFALNVVMSIAFNAIVRTSPNIEGVVIIGGLILIFAVITAATFPSNKKIGVGMGWDSSKPVIASLLMGLNSALCCGIIGYIIVQSIAAKEMKKYGIAGGAFGIKKSLVKAKLEAMRANPTPTPPPFQT